MESMVESLLEYTKIGNWQVETENINTKEIFQEVAANFTPALKGNNIHLILERNLPPVFFYKSGLRQVFSNLIDNAIKYARDDINSYIKVGINNSTIANSSFEHFYIEDNGVGISPHDANIIFDIFQRGVKCAQKKGYGIGLAVVKKILDTMNCSIRVESKESEQTRFYFTLPKARHC
jgi:signal transduction histidine kinase